MCPDEEDVVVFCLVRLVLLLRAVTFPRRRVRHLPPTGQHSSGRARALRSALRSGGPACAPGGARPGTWRGLRPGVGTRALRARVLPPHGGGPAPPPTPGPVRPAGSSRFPPAAILGPVPAYLAVPAERGAERGRSPRRDRAQPQPRAQAGGAGEAAGGRRAQPGRRAAAQQQHGQAAARCGGHERRTDSAPPPFPGAAGCGGTGAPCPGTRLPAGPAGQAAGRARRRGARAGRVPVRAGPGTAAASRACWAAQRWARRFQTS